MNPQGLSWSVGIRDLGLLGICALFIGQLPWRHIKDHQRTESQHLSEAEGLPTLPLSRSVALGPRLSYLPHRTGRALMASPGHRAPGRLGKLRVPCTVGWFSEVIYSGKQRREPPCPPVLLPLSLWSGPACREQPRGLPVSPASGSSRAERFKGLSASPPPEHGGQGLGRRLELRPFT